MSGWWPKLRRWLRRMMSRAGWSVHLLSLPRADVPRHARGLILIQVDGLPRHVLEKALDAGEMPFLKRLLTRWNYRLFDHYSGLPSSTPGVQAEIFYGVRGAVPAFGFRDSASRKLTTMTDSETAAAVEERLSQEGSGLLAGGSCYCNIYTGGAAEAHFCMSKMGWNAVLRAANPFARALVSLLHIMTLVRAIALTIGELFLAVYDMFGGLIQGRNFFHELKFIPARIVVCVLLREWITMSAQFDAARGLPIIHVNFLGYDEQSHRRGPTSRFARWTLKGIDRAIRDIWNVAAIRGCRHYALWVYSDHGQEDAAQYYHQHNETLENAITDTLKPFGLAGNTTETRDAGVQNERRKLIRQAARPQALVESGSKPVEAEPNRLQVSAVGPVGFIYLPAQADEETLRRAARALVDEAHLPMVVRPEGEGGARAWTAAGEFSLPRDATQLFGNHRFRKDLQEDLLRIARHRDAGDFMFVGWGGAGEPVTFPAENGAHAGPGPHETHGFALLPFDAPVDLDGKDYLRPDGLRAAVQRFRKMAEQHDESGAA